MIRSAIVLSGMLFGISGIFQSPLQAPGCTFDVCHSSQILNFSFHNSLSLMFVQKSCFKSVLSFNSSRLWNIPSFSLDAAVSHRKKNYWLYGETWIAFFPKLTDGLKIPLIEAVLPLSTWWFWKKGLFEEIWSPLQHIIMLLTEGLRFGMQPSLPPLPSYRKGREIIWQNRSHNK